MSTAVKYEVQVSTDSTFPAPLVWSTTTANTMATPPTDRPIGTYWWRVRAVGSDGVGTNCNTVTGFVFGTTWVPETLNPACEGHWEWAVQGVEDDNDTNVTSGGLTRLPLNGSFASRGLRHRRRRRARHRCR